MRQKRTFRMNLSGLLPLRFPSASKFWRLVLRSLTFGFFLMAMAVVALMLRYMLLEYRLDFQPDRRPVPFPKDQVWTDLQLVNLAPAGADRESAFYQAPTNGKLVIFVHGSGANRGQLMPEAAILARLGYGVLSVDLPGHGLSTGKITWGQGEKKFLINALNWLEMKFQGTSLAIGMYGFSMGSWMSLMVGTHDHRIQAMVLAGSFADTKDIFMRQSGRYKWLAYWPTTWLARAMGFRYWEDRPIDLVYRFAPRALLFITGDRDVATPTWMRDKLFQAALEPKTSLLVPGAAHGDYYRAQPKLFERHISNFFEENLLPAKKLCCFFLQ